MEQYTSLNQRLRNIEGTYLEFKGMIDRIKQDHEMILRHGRTMYSLGVKITALLKHSAYDSTRDKKRTENHQKSTIISNAEIPVVSKKSIAKNNKTGNPIDCPRCNYHWLHNAKGKYVTCSRCHKHIVL
jgi:hypothetical protein